MEKIVSTALPTDIAAAYFLRVLEVGGSRDAALRQHLHQGSFYALAPEGTDVARLVDLKHGGLLPALPKISGGSTAIQRVPNTVTTAATIVKETLFQYENPVLWLHEPLFSETEVISKSLPYRLIEGNIYLRYTSDLNAENQIADWISYSLQSWHFLACVTEGPAQPASIADLVFSSKLTMAGAYDGESFLYKMS